MPHDREHEREHTDKIVWVTATRRPLFGDRVYRVFEESFSIELRSLASSAAADARTTLRRICHDCADRAALVLDLRGGSAEPLRWLGEVSSPPLVVVADSADEAASAWDAGAVDYLVAGRHELDRIEDCVQRLVDLAKERVPVESVLAPLLDPREPRGPDRYLEKLLVPAGRKLRLIHVRDIRWIQARNNYVDITTDQRRYVKRIHLSHLARSLDPKKFLRIHRSTLVNVESIDHMMPAEGSSSFVVLDDGTKLSASRRYRRSVLLPYFERYAEVAS